MVPGLGPMFLASVNVFGSLVCCIGKSRGRSLGPRPIRFDWADQEFLSPPPCKLNQAENRAAGKETPTHVSLLILAALYLGFLFLIAGWM